MGHKLLKTLYLILEVVLLGSCNWDFMGAEASPTYDYSDFKYYQICYKDIFFQAKTAYFVYIYSLRCGHCLAIKQDVLSYITECKMPTYLLEYNENIKISSNVSSTIGISNVDDLYILGTPTLIKIENNVLTLNVAGQDEVLTAIKNS